MKTFFYSIPLLLLLSCKKEKSFADKIILHYDHGEKLSFQQFNEGIDETGSSIIYVGKDTSSINVKYFMGMMDPPPPPPGSYADSTYREDQEMLSRFLYNRFGRIKFSEKPVVFDSLSKQSVEIGYNINDTIPKYVYNLEMGTLKKYKAFPVFVKNISGKKLILHEFKSLPLAVLNDQQKWQILSNDNALICGDSRSQYRYWEFNPNEIMVLSVNFLEGKDKGKFKICFHDYCTEVFLMNYDKSIIERQRNRFELK
ncbi:hypothetical protein N6B72_06890 [Chryseobacterium soli]|nr:hypothetical protein [Chryseobacterium soli]MDV7696639.1 hypothetical protein [Chryseobacterium soli]